MISCDCVQANRACATRPSAREAAAPGGLGVVVEGQGRRIDKEVGRRMRRLLTTHPGLAARWLAGISFRPDPADEAPSEARS